MSIIIRQSHVATMMIARMTLAEMAQKLNVSEATISRDRRALLSDWATNRQKVYDEFDIEMALINRMIASLIPEALNHSFPHIDQLGQWLDRKARRLQYDSVRIVWRGEAQIAGAMVPHEMSDEEIDQELANMGTLEELIDAEVKRRMAENIT